MDDRDYSSTLWLVEDNENDVESTLAALIRRAAYPSQGAENPKARLLGLNDRPSSAAERVL